MIPSALNSVRLSPSTLVRSRMRRGRFPPAHPKTLQPSPGRPLLPVRSQLHLKHRSLAKLNLTFGDSLNCLPIITGRRAGEKSERTDVDPENWFRVLGQMVRYVKDGAVTAEHHEQVRLFRKLGNR